jgi:hypothetical protein
VTRRAPSKRIGGRWVPIVSVRGVGPLNPARRHRGGHGAQAFPVVIPLGAVGCVWRDGGEDFLSYYVAPQVKSVE